MSVVLLILKIIGIILLAVLGLLLFLLFLVLFVPIRYRMEGGKEEQFRMEADVRWLSPVLAFRFSYRKEETECWFRFLWFRKRLDGEEDDYIIPEEDDGAIPQEDDSFIPEEDDGTIPQEETVLLQHSDSGGNGAGFSMESGGSGKTKADRKKKKKKKKRRMVSEFFHSLRRTLKRFLAQCRQMKDMLCRGKALLEDEINQRSVRLIFRELRYLLRHSGFRRIQTNLTFALWEPSATGQFLGVLCMLPVMYRYEIQVYPDFEAESAYVRGSFQIKGHIRLIHMLVSFLRLLKEREFRIFVKRIMRMLSQYSG